MPATLPHYRREALVVVDLTVAVAAALALGALIVLLIACVWLLGKDHARERHLRMLTEDCRRWRGRNIELIRAHTERVEEATMAKHDARQWRTLAVQRGQRLTRRDALHNARTVRASPVAMQAAAEADDVQELTTGDLLLVEEKEPDEDWSDSGLETEQRRRPPH